MDGPFIIGTQVRMQLILKDYDDALVAGTVVCNLKDPSGNASTPSVTNPSTGVYHAFVTTDEAGEWPYQFVSSGATVAVGESSFQVIASAFP